ncbi:MAG: hypothetical protein A2X94_03485 [Bdellovibrionales bacterium GWB1_55_8]|nr:MAG: hypothetical protein A2X94_03485 [Bdellovibrionales bacterium GWB1_55_8]
MTETILIGIYDAVHKTTGKADIALRRGNQKRPPQNILLLLAGGLLIYGLTGFGKLQARDTSEMPLPSPAAAKSQMIVQVKKQDSFSSATTAKSPLGATGSNSPQPELKLVIHNPIEDDAQDSEDAEDSSAGLEVSEDKPLYRGMRPPGSLFRQLGNRANQVWQVVSEEPREHRPQSSLTLPIAPALRKTISASQLASGSKTREERRDILPSQKPRSVVWQLSHACNGPQQPEKMLIGFVVKALDLNQDVLKQTFIELNPEDPFGCAQYSRSLADFLPNDSDEGSFQGWLSITGLMVGKRETDEVVWQNLVRPRQFAVDDHGSARVELAWDPSSDPDVAGYRCYYGRKSRQYTHVLDTGNANTFVVSGLTPGKWYFTITAYNSAGVESDYSNEFETEVPGESK